MVDGGRSQVVGSERQERKYRQCVGTPGWVIQSVLMREKRKIKQPSINRKCVRTWKGRMLHIYRLPLIKIDKCEVEWSTLDAIWIIAILLNILRLLTCDMISWSAPNIEIYRYIYRNILQFTVKYRVESIRALVNSRFALLRDPNEKFCLADRLGRCIF